MGRFGVSRHILLAILAVILGVGAIFVVQNATKTEAAPGINKTINFQGKMTDANGLNVADGTYQFVFRFYTVASSGSAVWTETVNLSVVDGIFQHNLGSSTALPGSVDFNTDNIFLGITFNSDSAGEMSPRVQLTASPYAFNADQLDGLDADDLVQLNPSAAQTGDIAITGDVSAGTLTLSDGSSNTGTIEVDSLGGNYTYTIPTTSGNDVFCLEGLGNCGGSLFTDGGVVSYLTSTTDQLSIGSSSDLDGKLQIVNDTATNSALLLRAAASQSAAMIMAQDNSGNELFRIHAPDNTSVFLGSAAGLGIGTSADSVGIGANALDSATGGVGNTAVGRSALNSVTGGNNNTALGAYALQDMVSGGEWNTAVGSGSMAFMSGGYNNVGLGYATLQQNSGSDNVALGAYALNTKVGGSGNIAIGHNAASNLTDGHNNIVIGAYLDIANTTGSYQLNIAGLLTSSNYQSSNLVVGTSDTTGQLLVLDTKTDAGDPTGNQVNGGMYYNSNTGKFRCYEGSVWKDCISTGGTGDILQNGNSFGATMTIGTNDANSLVFEANNQPALTIADGGAVTFQNATDSTDAFNVRNTSGDNLLRIDTVNNRTGINLPGWMSLDYSFQLQGYASSTQSYANTYGADLSGSTTNHQAGHRFTSVFNSPASASWQTYSNIQSHFSMSLTANTANSTYEALNFDAWIAGSGSAANVTGLRVGMGPSEDGSVGNVRGLHVGNLYGGAGGSVTNNYGIQLDNPTGSGTLTNNYGLNVQNQVAGANNYGVYIQGASTYALWVDSGASRFDGQVNIGEVDAAGTIFVLDNKNTSGDSGVATANGAMYYNSADSKFRCYEGGSWKDCISAGGGLSGALTDNMANAWDVQEGTNNYFNINTTDSSEALSFGNATTNPDYNFLGSGTLTVSGPSSFNNTLAVSATAPNVNMASVVSIDAQLTSATNNQHGMMIETEANPGSTGSANMFAGFSAGVNNSSGSVSNDTLIGVSGSASLQGTSGAADMIGGAFGVTNMGSGTVADAVGLSAIVMNAGSGSITNAVGVSIIDYASATNNTSLLINAAGAVAGNWSIYNANTADNIFAGDLRIGSTSAPTVALDVTGAGAFSGALSTSAGLSVGGGAVIAGQTRISSMAAPALTSGAGAFNIGNVAGTHIAFGSNDIQAKSDATTAGTLDLNPLGGLVTMGGGLSVSGNLTPSLNDTYDLGTNTLRWRDLYLGGETIHIGASTSDEATISYNSTSDSLIIKNATNSTGAFQVQNSTNQSLLQVDTTGAGSVTLLGNNSGETTAWTANTNSLPANQGWNGGAYANGYIYSIGGGSEVYFARLNTNGSTGTWSSTTSLPAGRSLSEVVSANGYIYVIGGSDTNTVYYARPSSNGTISAWNTTSTLPAQRQDGAAVALNGYIYYFGGRLSTSYSSAIYYAKINPNGSLGTWQTSIYALSTTRGAIAAAASNNRIYLSGGSNGTVTDVVMRVEVPALGGDFSSTSTDTSLPAARGDSTAAVVNGYLYNIAGYGASGFARQVYYAKINANGTLGAWSTSAHLAGSSVTVHASVTANGYLYTMGGYGIDDVYYARAGGVVNVGGNLDLVGIQGQSYSDGGDSSQGSSGGSITAGNITALGILQANGDAIFSKSVTVNQGATINNGLTVLQTSDATLTNFTQAISNAGILMNYTAVDNTYTPGLFWGATDNNPTKPKAGIWLHQSNTAGTTMLFGTSNAYATGITNNSLAIAPSGNIGAGTITPRARLNIDGGLAIGPGGTGVNTTHGANNSIQLLTDTSFGGTYDNHSGYLMYSTMPAGGWDDAQLNFATSTDWATYNTTTPALALGQSSSSFSGSLLSGGTYGFTANTVGDKINLYSTSYGIGIESSTLTNWSGSQFRWRTGGTSVSSGTEKMVLSSGWGLTISDNLTVGGAIVAPAGTLRDSGGGWVRTYGATGWYSQTYNGGWYMQDTTYIRNYASKQVYLDNTLTIASGELVAPTVNIPESPTNTVQVCYEFAGGGRIRMRRCSSSSQRYKHDINTYVSGIQAVRQLRPVTFLYNQGHSADTSLQVGFIAEEVAAVDPLFAIYKDGQVESVRYDRITVLNTNAIKELDVEVQSNTSRIQVVEQTLSNITVSQSGYALSSSVQSMAAGLTSRIEILEQGNFTNLQVTGTATIKDLVVTGDTQVRNLTVKGRIITAGTTPAAAVLASYTAADATVTVSGNDTAGEVRFVTNAGMAPVAGQQFTVTFTSPFGTKPRINATALSAAAAGAKYFIEPTTTGFTVSFIDPPEPDQEYGFNYFVVQ